MIIDTFHSEWENLSVTFIETLQVQDWVQCDVYEFVNDATKDLWIVRLSKGMASPHQLVVWGDKTLLWYMSGSWKFILETDEGIFEYKMRKDVAFQIVIHKWEKMQWIADSDSELMYYEVYLPPYKDGRYLDL